MDELLESAPCGFLTLSKEGIIQSINRTLLKMLQYNKEQLVGKHIDAILSKSARVFFQLYFTPLIMKKQVVEEMYLSLADKNGEDIPILLNAALDNNKEDPIIVCIMVPMRRRDAYENQLRIAKKVAEDAKSELELVLQSLEDKQEQLLVVNKQTQNELQLAKKIQETSLTKAITTDSIQMETYYKASSELSGDIYGFYQMNKDQYGIILLDVMGHGISSSLITMSLHSLFQRLISRGISASLLMKELDNHLHELFQNSEDVWHYCTAIYLVIDTNKKTIEYVNAGHPPAIFQDLNGEQQALKTTTPPLGTFEGIQFTPNKIYCKNGGRLLLYTDGVSEPLEPISLFSILKECSADSLSETKATIIRSLQGEDKQVQHDDQCFILIDLK
ncbi:SpoIIE family protein phosphatase [Aquibacillus salsiterrae]|uniref:SpoIIE family protein phosphatase n=1 Tax=Aquibacillus salsiterrae TaxID=2950439 RepID=A0A9X4AG85_9BACI|nr:SpoIIE family protein phosphatase [Aquibacillus salsiterrae]MDC3418419.1 SpoIIE family protein phosphatase [Aquibacillus salsiterrae]